MGHKVIRYSIFVIGLLLAGMSFMLCIGNALIGEGRSQSIPDAAFIGTMAGSTIACLAIITGAVIARRLLPLAVSVMGGLAAAIAGWSLWSLGGATSILEPMLAACFAPIGMWLGWIGASSRSRMVVGATVGGAVAAVAAEVVFPLLLNIDGPPINYGFYALFGLVVGGVCGIVSGAALGWVLPPRAGAGG